MTRLNLIQDQVNPSSIDAFSFFHWNLNNISKHNYAKIFLLKVYITIHKFDIICIPETYLDSDNNLEMHGYNLIGSDQKLNK